MAWLTDCTGSDRHRGQLRNRRLHGRMMTQYLRTSDYYRAVALIHWKFTSPHATMIGAPFVLSAHESETRGAGKSQGM
jgi:hypothetical protein